MKTVNALTQDNPSSSFVSDLPDGVWDIICSEMRKTFVAIAGHTRVKNPDLTAKTMRDRHAIDIFFESGFMVQFDSLNSLFIITAGHVIRNCLKPHDSSVYLHSLRVLDGGPCLPENKGVPVRPDMVYKALTYKNEFDPDYGVLGIPIYETCQILSAENSVALTEKNVSSESEEFDAYFLIGFPVSARENLKIKNTDTTFSYSQRIASPVLAVSRISDPHKNPRNDRFVARIDDSSDPRLNDIIGMSGGPIFGIRIVDDYMEFKIVAVQSSWRSDTRTIYAEYFKPFFDVVKHTMEEHVRSSSSNSPGAM